MAYHSMQSQAIGYSASDEASSGPGYHREDDMAKKAALEPQRDYDREDLEPSRMEQTLKDDDAGGLEKTLTSTNLEERRQESLFSKHGKKPDYLRPDYKVDKAA